MTHLSEIPPRMLWMEDPGNTLGEGNPHPSRTLNEHSLSFVTNLTYANTMYSNIMRKRFLWEKE